MKRRLAVAAAACGLLVVPAGAQAAPIDVTTTIDEYSAANNAACSLREAVEAASTDQPFGGCPAGDAPGEDVVRLLDAGYTLTRQGIDEDLNSTGDLDLDVGQGPIELRFVGTGRAAIDASGDDRALDVSGDTAVELVRLRLLSGDPIGTEFNDESGGALRWEAAGGPGDLAITDSVLFGNFAVLAGAVDAQTAGEHLVEDSLIHQNFAADQGAIRSEGRLTVRGSTVSGNGGGGIYAEKAGPDSLELADSAVTGNQIGADLSPAGGVRLMGDGEIVNSTVSGNIGGFVGGVLAEEDLTVRFSTIASNGAPDAGGSAAGGVDVLSADSVSFEGSILAGNELPSGPSDCNEATASEPGAPNLESATSCGFDSGAGSLTNSDPQLAPLGAYGGPTQTRGLYPDSPAIDAAGDCLPLAGDQRGSVRPAGTACDIGAFEGSVPRPPEGSPTGPSTPTKPKKKKKCRKAKAKKGKGKKKSKRCGKKKKSKGKAAAASTVASAASSSEVIGRSVEGTAIRAVQIGDPEAERVALVVGAIHGDERAGIRVTKRLRRMRSQIDDAQIWVVDNLNPDGSRIDVRVNARNVDLNRNFPHNWGSGEPAGSGYYPGPRAASEPETRAAMGLIKRIRPDLTIWYHQPWGAVLTCGGRPKLADRYADLVSMAPSCAGRGLPGTATGWQRDEVGGTAFVVEFGDGPISGRTAGKHARAAIALAEDGLSARRPPAAASARAAALKAPDLKVAKRLIPYPRSRKLDMAAYSKRHYGKHRWELTDPKLIVIHFAVAGSIDAIFNTFAPNRPDVEYGELPGVCSHYAVGSGGGAVKFVAPGVRCRHVVGLNHVSIGIEHVGFSDGQVLGRKAQLRGSLRLTQSLRCRYDIPVRRVIGHAESLSSPFYKELDPDFKGRTHSDFKRASMRVYRRELSELGDC